MESTMTKQNGRMTAFNRNHADIEALIRYFRDLTEVQVQRESSDEQCIDRQLRLHEIYWTLVRAAASLQGVEPYDIVDWLAYLAARAKAESVQS